MLVRIDSFKAAPSYDPFMFLVLSASGDDVDTVLVDGKTIVEKGRVLAVDMPTAVAKLNQAADRVRRNVAL
jgi:cytosine/adenosine deaminase-related metal-dependent hydrolase